MNYIEEIKKELDKELKMGDNYNDLLDLYVLLIFTKGVKCTNKNVHDAWSVWQNNIDNKHISLMPYNKLTKETQELDTEYRNAIIKISEKFRQ